MVKRILRGFCRILGLQCRAGGSVFGGQSLSEALDGRGKREPVYMLLGIMPEWSEWGWGGSEELEE